jgi:hypothetical protein
VSREASSYLHELQNRGYKNRLPVDIWGKHIEDEYTGHRTSDCKENRKFDLNDIPDKVPEEAWAAMKKASDEEDLEEFRKVRILFPCVSSVTVADRVTGLKDLFQGCPIRNVCGYWEENAGRESQDLSNRGGNVFYHKNHTLWPKASDLQDYRRK